MAKLDSKLGMIVDSVGNFFFGKDQLPLCDPALNASGLDKFLKSIGRNPSYVDLEYYQQEAEKLYAQISNMQNNNGGVDDE
ncbi:hypothetical protein HN51_021182 [Arachis hypogaea]